ncbi:Cof-type HAD-IIB family hydrolase [Intestinibacillus massiliensis]|uniref:Cof-type HAD-IIB family hydrolase n=1 Tax=Intestinibacillus massiliensis TaxID=1871029 RepID=UPI000B34F22B|nr:HAD family hydrolase [Intestinibacillus massiliensis]
MPKYKLLALDLDGTLLDENSRVPEENARAVRTAQGLGVQVALCTGRNAADARRFSAMLAAPADWAVTANGADVRPLDGGAPVYTAPLERTQCDTILQICSDFEADPCLYTADKLYYGWEFRKFVASLRGRGHPVDEALCDPGLFIGAPAAWQALLGREPEPFIKAILYHSDPDMVDRMQDALAQTGLFELAPSVMYGGALKNVEVNRKGVHKGRALAALAAQLGMGLDEVMAVGDSDNDLTMLQMAGLGVAMGDAAAHIRAAADAVTDGYTACGVARAIERYILEGTR